MNLILHVWRQPGPDQPGRFVRYEANDISDHASFLEMLDIVNERLTEKGEEPIAFEHDCREGICGSCGIVIDGSPHGLHKATTTCQLHMRHYKNGDEIWIEPWRAKPFPVLKDLVVDRTAFERILHAGGYVSVNTGSAPMNTHGNVAFNSEVYRHCWKLTPSDTMLAVAPFFHVTGMVGHIGTCVASATPLILYYRFDPRTTFQMIERWRATCTIGAITVFIALMNDPEIGKYDLSSFRKVYSGEAPVIPAVVERFEKLTGTYIHNVYGLTESTSPATLVPLGSRAPVDPLTGGIAIAVPIPSHEAKIMDLSNPEKELPPGEVGELAIKGPGIIPGYWNKPEETPHAIRQGWLFTGYG